jgi:hypothetical protein
MRGYNFSIMLKALIYIFLIYLVLPVKGQTKAAQSDKDKSTANNVHQTLPPITVTVVNQQTPTTEEQKSKRDSESYFYTLISANNLPNIALFFVGTGGVWVGLRTLKKIERQTSAAEKQLVLQFRPKLIVRGGEVDFEDGTISFLITNTGGSKAHVSHSFLKFDIFEKGEDGIAIVTNSGKDVLVEDLIFDPGESKKRVLGFNPTFVASIREQFDTVRAVHGAKFTRILKCAGGISYRDDLGIERMTMIKRHFDPITGKFSVPTNSEGDYAD